MRGGNVEMRPALARPPAATARRAPLLAILSTLMAWLLVTVEDRSRQDGSRTLAVSLVQLHFFFLSSSSFIGDQSEARQWIADLPSASHFTRRQSALKRFQLQEQRGGVGLARFLKMLSLLGPTPPASQKDRKLPIALLLESVNHIRSWQLSIGASSAHTPSLLPMITRPNGSFRSSHQTLSRV